MEYTDYSLPETSLDEVVGAMSFAEEDAMDVDDDTNLREDSSMTAEENAALTTQSAAAFESSLSACVDFFYKVLDVTLYDGVESLLAAAWAEDANVALRLVFQLRDIRNGKGVEKPFLYSLLWLRRHHFRTLLYNLKYVADVGRWKDLLDLLVLDVVGSQSLDERRNREAHRAAVVGMWAKKKRLAKGTGEKAKMTAHEKAAVYRTAVRVDKDAVGKAAREAFVQNLAYRELHVMVASLFAEALKKDLELTKELKPVSLASKWAPTACKHHDKFTLVVSTLSELLFPQKDLRKEGSSYATYVSTARNLYRKVYLTPLRKYSNVIERFMSDGKWTEIPFDRVPSRCMKRNKTLFVEKDLERFQNYLQSVEEGKKKIHAAALNPHELVNEFLGRSSADMEENAKVTIQLQWAAYVKKLAESGSLSNCMAVCDVSGSMTGLPMQVAIALSLLVAELAREPYRGVVCTFSSEPELFVVPEGTLDVKVNAVRGMNWGMNTNIDAVFELILDRAAEAQLPRDGMIKRLFIFSDMQFDVATSGAKTNYESAKERFQAAGYDLPQIVFWNLRAGDVSGKTSVPVCKTEEGTALVSGFSGQLLKLFMEGKVDEFDPISILMKAVEPYSFLRVVD